MIRPYEPRDLETIMDIANRAWRNITEMFRRSFGDELFAIVRPRAATVKGEEVREFCAKTPENCLICEEDGRIVGFVTLMFDRKRGIGEIGNNAADPDAGVKGVGQQMYHAALERFRQEGMRAAMVRTGLDEAHAPARRAYERAGFATRHESVIYYKLLQDR